MAAPPGQQQQPMMEHQREPCPDRILDDIGGAFGMGAVGGGAWHLVKGLRNSPSGFRMKGALEAVRRESPRLGASFANWGLSFSVFDCTLQYIRKKEDPWNAIMAGAATGGFLQLRHGYKSAAQSALFGGFLLALIEGVGIALNKMTSPPPPGVPYQPAMGVPPPAGGPPAPGPGVPAGLEGSSGEGGSWFSGISSFFGGGGSEQASGSSSGKDLSEDPFLPPPMPEFRPVEAKTDPGFK